MKYGAILLLLLVRCWSQTGAAGKATTSGSCSPANTGNNNTFTIHCGVSQKQGQKMLDILNKILANQLDPEAVMAKLDEILKAVNPNIPVKTYFCNGQWKTMGPSANAALSVNMGGDDQAFKEMAHLYNSRQYVELLNVCHAQIDSSPEWLTPSLFCGLAYLGTGDKEKAKGMIAAFDSKTGPAYATDQCAAMSDYLHKALEP